MVSFLGILRPNSSVVERFHGKEEVPSSILGLGSIHSYAGVAKRSNATDCKSVGLVPSGVRIPLPAP